MNKRYYKKLEQLSRQRMKLDRQIFQAICFPHTIVYPKRKAVRKDFTDRVKIIVLDAQGSRCRMCFMYLDVYEFDHMDGNKENNSFSNCQALCPNCHARKSRYQRFWARYQANNVFYLPGSNLIY